MKNGEDYPIKMNLGCFIPLLVLAIYGLVYIFG